MCTNNHVDDTSVYGDTIDICGYGKLTSCGSNLTTIDWPLLKTFDFGTFATKTINILVVVLALQKIFVSKHC